jgi:hypothetical protein
VKYFTAKVEAAVTAWHARELARAVERGAVATPFTLGRRTWTIVTMRRPGRVAWRLYDDRPRRVGMGEVAVVHDSARAERVARCRARLEADALAGQGF